MFDLWHTHHLDLAPAVARSDVQLPSLLRHIHQGSLSSTVGLSGESLTRLIGDNLNTHHH